MSEKTAFLNRIDEPVDSTPDKFIAIAGSRIPGSKPAAGLQMGSYYMSRTYTTEIYMDVVKDMIIDGQYSSFYDSDKTKNERFTSISEALRRYNEVVKENAETPEIASQYLIQNIPEEVIKFKLGCIQAQGWGAKSELCTILHFAQSAENQGQHTVLLEKGGKFAVVENIPEDKWGLNLREVSTSEFRIENLQDALDQYAVRTKGKEEDKEVTGKLEPSKQMIAGLTGKVDTQGINGRANVIREQLTPERETPGQDITDEN